MIRKYLVIISLIFICAGFGFSQTSNTFFFFPFYMPETSLGLVFTDIMHFKKQEDKFFSALNLVALYTLKHQFTVGAVPSVYFDDNNYLLEGRVFFTNFLRKFYGIGNNTSKDDEEEYINRSYGFNIGLSRKVVSNFMLGVQYSLFDNTMQDTDDDGILQYIKTNGVTSGAGFKAKFDTRDSNIYPTKGVLMKAEYLLYNNRFGSKYNFSVTNFDFRNYFYIQKKKVLFSYQLFAEFVNGQAPIQNLPGIGGQNLLRGFYSNRYVDNIVLALQPEIKIKITNVIQFVLFSGIGNVYNTLEDIDLTKIKTASGCGIRIKVRNSPRTNFRLDYAQSNESNGFYFTLMEAF